MSKRLSKKNWLIVILLLTNFIALGYIVTLHARQYILSGLTQSELSPYSVELQSAYRESLEPNWFELLKAIRAIKLDKKQLHDFMIAEKVDRDAIKKQQAKLRASQMQLIKILHDAMPDALENISAEERAKIPNASLRSFSFDRIQYE